MQTSRANGLITSGIAIVGLLFACSAQAQDAARGKTLFETANSAPIACSNSGCHGPTPALNVNNIRSANSASGVLTAISTVPTMRFLSSFISAADAADLAAYIVNPTTSAAAISVSASTLSFTASAVNTATTSSTPSSITLTNSGTAILTISAIAKSGAQASEFNLAGSCISSSAVSVAVGASCTLSGTFLPTATGARSASLAIQSNASSNPSISLTGTGLTPVTASVSLNPIALSFNAQLVGSTSTAKQITLQNTGMASLSITQVGATPSSEFVTTSNCVGNLASSQSCTVNVAFSPAGSGTRSGSISIVSNAPGSPHTVVLTGAGNLAPAPSTAWSASSLAFAQQAIGTMSGAQTVTMTNNGNAALNLATIAVGGANAAEFVVTAGTTCAAGSIAVGASCTIEVKQRPLTMGVKSAALLVTHNAASGLSTIGLQGQATASSATASNASASGASLTPSNVGGGGALTPAWAGLLVLALLLAPWARRQIR